MDAWFSYVLKLSELIFNMKLEAYEDACATLVLSAAGVYQEAAPTSPAGAETSTSEASPSADVVTKTESAGTPPPRSDDTATDVGAKDRLKAESVGEGNMSSNRADHGPTPTQSSVSPARAKEERSEFGADSITSTSAAVCRAASPTAAPPPPPPSSSRRAAPPTASPAEAVSALLDAMQLRRPLHTIPSQSQLLDDIQGEAELVYQDLEEVYTLQPGDVAAVRRTIPHSPPASPRPPEAGSRSSGSPADHAPDQPFPSSAAAAASWGEGGVLSPTLGHQLLYGELTSVGVRQLQAISMACVSVSREHLTRSQSQNFGYGATPPGHSPGMAAGVSYNCSGIHAGSARTTTGGTSPLASSNVPHGAVVVGVDVGCGNGRLLFEWARLGAAACRRRPDGSRRRSRVEDGNPSPLATPQSTHNNSMVGSTYAAAVRRGNLLAAAMSPLGVHAVNVVWRGWLGMGIEMVPSRIRVARRALVPHYLNLKPALLIPTGGLGQGVQHEDFPVPQLDPVAPEAIAVSTSSGSFSSPVSLGSTAMARTGPSSMTCSPTSANPCKSLAAARIPQPTARVMLYEGDALAPGVLSNATLCRFPAFTLPGDTLMLLRGGGSVVVPAKTRDLVNGLGGDHMGSLGTAGYYTGGSMNAPITGDADTCPYPATNVAAAGAALNNAYLNSAISGALGRRASAGGGPASFTEVSMCSPTSNTSSTCSTRGGSAKHNYYRLCRVENGPSLSGKEDPHLVVFCCGLGFDEQQVWRLCQRLEDMLLARTAPTTSPTRPASMDGFPSSRNMSEDETSVAPFSATNNSEYTDGTAASPVMGNGASVSSDDNGEVLEEMARGFGRQVSTPTGADPTPGSGGSLARDISAYRHWESITCVMLLRSMDVLAPNFPLFRYATRVYTTQDHPVAAEDTAFLLATGNRTDGTAARYVMRDLPISDSVQDANMASTIQESEIWTTTLETTWMNAAPAWVVRFRF
jgi:hypothetical protein